MRNVNTEMHSITHGCYYCRVYRKTETCVILKQDTSNVDNSKHGMCRIYLCRFHPTAGASGRLPGLAAGGLTTATTPFMCGDTRNYLHCVIDMHRITQELQMIGSTARALVLTFHHLTSNLTESTACTSSVSMGDV